MARIHVSETANAGLAGYKKCEKCNAPLSRLIVGGVGDWRTTIVCGDCFHVRRGVHFERVILPLLGELHGCGETEMARREDASQADYLASLAAWARGEEE